MGYCRSIFAFLDQYCMVLNAVSNPAAQLSMEMYFFKEYIRHIRLLMFLDYFFRVVLSETF